MSNTMAGMVRPNEDWLDPIKMDGINAYIDRLEKCYARLSDEVDRFNAKTAPIRRNEPDVGVNPMTDKRVPEGESPVGTRLMELEDRFDRTISTLSRLISALDI